MFRRRRAGDDGDDVELDDDLDGPEDGLEDGPENGIDDEYDDEPPPVARPRGPWDVADVADDLERIDFGGLKVAVRPGHELRVDVDPATQNVVALTFASPSSIMQLMAFAAPKTTGIWADVRLEIAESLAGSGGRVEEATGPYGTELRAEVPTDQAGALVPARFLGVDGPRWFLRAMVQGRAAVEPDADPELLAALRDVVVERGGDAMAVRDPLPLRLPKDVQQQVDQHAADAAAPSLELPERGPEITETR